MTATTYDGWSDEDLVAELCGIKRGLTDWEVGFTESIARQLERTGSLSAGQRAKARQVLDDLDDRKGVERGA